MAITTALLMSAALCQLLLVVVCLGGFLELVYQWSPARESGAAQPQSAAGPPGTLAVLFSAMFLAASLLLLSFPSFIAGELPNGLFFISAVGFGGFAMSAICAMGVTRSASKVAIAQLCAGFVGLICLFATYYLTAKT
ncbi:MAG: hypothetical protein NTV73_08380 [Hyphomicrobiales bacterium]|nr:hypothetical protein [Hyphomicrobiales bacterium]